MDQQTFLNEYLKQISNECKNLMMDKIMLNTQKTILTAQIEELTKTNDQLKNQITELQKKIEKKKVKDDVVSDFTN